MLTINQTDDGRAWLKQARQGVPMTPLDQARRWFREHPDRTYHARPATREEIEDLREQGAFDDKRLAQGCYFFALFKIDREAITLEGRIAVLEPGAFATEEECKRAWQSTERGALQ